MSIQDMNRFTEAVWDWGILKGCFGGKISPSDTDGMVERGGHFLYIEAKGSGVGMTRGQEIAIQNRVRDGLSTFVVVWGQKEQPERLRVYYPAPYLAVQDHYPADLQTLRDVCSRWYRYADSTLWTDALRGAVARL